MQQISGWGCVFTPVFECAVHLHWFFLTLWMRNCCGLMQLGHIADGWSLPFHFCGCAYYHPLCTVQFNLFHGHGSNFRGKPRSSMKTTKMGPLKSFPLYVYGMLSTTFAYTYIWDRSCTWTERTMSCIMHSWWVQLMGVWLRWPTYM